MNCKFIPENCVSLLVKCYQLSQNLRFVLTELKCGTYYQCTLFDFLMLRLQHIQQENLPHVESLPKGDQKQESYPTIYGEILKPN